MSSVNRRASRVLTPSGSDRPAMAGGSAVARSLDPPVSGTVRKAAPDARPNTGAPGRIQSTFKYGF